MKNPSQEITILPFQPENQAEVKRLVLAGLKEHWGELDPARNPDLDDIAQSYADGLFLVAWLDKQIIGTGAFLPRGENTAEIVRMSVTSGMRRKGVGRQILQDLCEQARSNGYQRIILETTHTWHEVIAFYRNFGFQVTHHLDGDVYFELELSKNV